MSLIDNLKKQVQNSQVWKSIFRHDYKAAASGALAPLAGQFVFNADLAAAVVAAKLDHEPAALSLSTCQTCSMRQDVRDSDFLQRKSPMNMKFLKIGSSTDRSATQLFPYQLCGSGERIGTETVANLIHHAVQAMRFLVVILVKR